MKLKIMHTFADHFSLNPGPEQRGEANGASGGVACEGPSTSKQGHHDLQGNNNANDLQTSNKKKQKAVIYMLLLVNK